MGIPYSGTDWKAALETCQPDIVSITTPGGAHFKPVKQAIEQGCHVFCDKSMIENGATAVASLSEIRYIPTLRPGRRTMCPMPIPARAMKSSILVEMSSLPGR